MTREEFKDAAMKILSNQYISLFTKDGDDWELFDSNDIEDFYISEHDDCDEEISTMPLDDFLDELYEVINNGT